MKPTSFSMALALLIGLLTINASAKVHNNSDNAKVIARISFSGLTPLNMTMQKRDDGKYYLYVEHQQKEGITVVDISRPKHPKTLGEVSWPDPAQASGLSLSGNFAIVSQSQNTMVSGSAAKQNLVLWDLSEPASPRVMQTFSGVVKWLEDDRDLIYVLNDEGLWIISQPEENPQTQSLSGSMYD